MLDLAEVHRLCARPGDCTDAVHAALDLYDAKGNAAAAARARRMLGRDGSGAPGERAHPSGG
jgi:hypothetical protein